MTESITITSIALPRGKRANGIPVIVLLSVPGAFPVAAQLKLRQHPPGALNRRKTIPCNPTLEVAFSGKRLAFTGQMMYNSQA